MVQPHSSGKSSVHCTPLHMDGDYRINQSTQQRTRTVQDKETVLSFSWLAALACWCCGG